MGRTATWLAVAAAIAVVVVVAVLMGRVWNELGPSHISTAGWVALTLGIVLAVALWIGLMTAMFISNRRGWDERAQLRRDSDPK